MGYLMTLLEEGEGVRETRDPERVGNPLGAI